MFGKWEAIAHLFTQLKDQVTGSVTHLTEYACGISHCRLLASEGGSQEASCLLPSLFFPVLIDSLLIGAHMPYEAKLY